MVEHPLQAADVAERFGDPVLAGQPFERPLLARQRVVELDSAPLRQLQRRLRTAA